MDMMFEAYLTQEAGHMEPDDIPHTKDPVWVLGKKYRAIDGEYDGILNLSATADTHTHTCVRARMHAHMQRCSTIAPVHSCC
jgi:choline kinase